MCTFLRNYCKNLIIYQDGETAATGRKRHIFCVDKMRRKAVMIRKLKTGEYRLYSKKKDPKTGKRRNLGTFRSRAAAEKHERDVQFFKRH
jgi:hypothetical protein